MKRLSNDRSRAEGRRRPGFYRPRLETLEERIPLGDTLGAVLGFSWLGSLLAALDPPPRAPAGGSAAGPSARGRQTGLAGQEMGNVLAALGPSRAPAAPAVVRPEAPGRPASETPPPATPLSPGGADDPLADPLGNAWGHPASARPHWFDLAAGAGGARFGDGENAASVPGGPGADRGTAPVPSTGPANREAAGLDRLAQAAWARFLATPGSGAAAHPAGSPAPLSPAPASGSVAANAYGRLPPDFQANRGQTDPQVQFVARGAGYSLFLTATEAVLVFPRSVPAPGGKAAGRGGPARRYGPGSERGADAVRRRQPRRGGRG
jgi:hypothetical protein